MDRIILYHGSPNREVIPQFGLGNEKHDYGKGFYLTEDIELAREWAVYRPDASNGWVHQFELDIEGLQSVSFAEFNEKYNERDVAARENMRRLIDSDRNRVTRVFSTLL